MAINKVVYGNNTLIDLTEDTVSANNLLAGETAHDRSGASIEGTVVTTEIWTGTQAEYEAQASQIADGTVVQITDDEKAITFIEAEEIYSTDERMVGVWVNGKPLYKRSFLFSTQVTVATTWTDIGIVLDEADSIIFGETQRSTAYAPLEFEIVPSTHHIRAVSYRSTSIPVGSFVTLYYTKTADVAGSGDFVPSGAPAVHYSTEEQVVGTWIDGRTVYEKTWSIDNTNVSSWVTIDHNISNFDMAISVVGSYKQSSGNQQTYIMPYYESSTAFGYIAFRDTTLWYRISGGLGVGKLVFTARYLKTS